MIPMTGFSLSVYMLSEYSSYDSDSSFELVSENEVTDNSTVEAIGERSSPDNTWEMLPSIAWKNT